MSTPFPNQVEILYMGVEHLTVLASAPCSEVLDSLDYKQPKSIREVSEELGKSTASIGEQLAKLLEVGLVVAAGTRQRRARVETLYVLSFGQIIMDLPNASEEAINEYITKFRCEMRLTDRLHVTAQRALRSKPDLLQHIHYFTSNGYLSKENAKKMKAALAQLHTEFGQLAVSAPQNGEQENFVRVKLATTMLPSQHESERIIKSAKKLSP
ncbi:MAG: ArsR family transcriptional regulator [Fimbriimonadaceae bacterium]